MLPDLSKLQPVPQQWHVDGRKSAVIILLIAGTDHGPANVVFTRRSLKVSSHKRQISLPGGRAERTDRGPGDTALRELHEELGVAPEKVSLHGIAAETDALDRTSVVAVVGSSSVTIEELEPDAEEVEDVFVVPWTELTRLQAELFSFNLFGQRRKSLLYRAHEQRIWGLTAHFIYQVGFEA